MRCLTPYMDKKNNRVFPCGQCHACRINYTSSWSLRLLYELKSWDSACFLTLTYDNEHLKSFSLCKKDFQDYMKRVRRDLGKSRKIKYYMCGEYGENKRPHFHAIIFGLDNYSDYDRKILKDNWGKCEDFLWLPISRFRKHSAIEPVCRESIQYVTGYVQKKLKGVDAIKEYDSKGLVRPYSACSNGLGLSFCFENKDRLIANGFTFYNGHRVPIPRYFRDKLELSQIDIMSSNHQKDYSEVFDDIEKDFIEYCKKYNINYDKTIENSKMYSIRFERFLVNRLYDIGLQIEKDFVKRQSFKGGIL